MGGSKLKLFKILSVLFVSILLGGIVLTGCEDKGDVIAVVNEEKIYKSDFNNMINGLYGANNEATEAQKKSIYESLINTKLIEQEVKARNLSVSDKDIDEYLKEVMAANGLENKEDFYKQLEETYGYDKAFVDSLIKSSLEEQKLYEDVIDKNVKEDEAVIKNAYDENPSKYKMVEVSHILVAIDDTVTKEVALTKAKSLIVRLNTGEDFAALAKANSADTGSSVNGGLLPGFFGADNTTYVEEFVDASVKLNKGEYTREPVLSQFGYHIIKANDVKASFDEVKDYVTEIIYGPIKEKAFTDLVDKLAKDAKIERIMEFDLTKDQEETEKQ